ncbi:MAG: efflux RND transporter periplasmic adaptor subunit, partial [Opitutales bacterium]
GQRVSRGELLLKISAAEISARVAQAGAQLNLARRDLERERDLLTRGASTAEMVRSLEDRFTLTEAMLHEAEAMLGYAELHAPFDGVVSRKLIDAGDLASPGQPLLEVEGTTDFQIEAGIPDSLAAPLAPGAVLTCEVSGVTFAARLLELSPSSDLSTRTVSAKLAVPAGTVVRSGQFVRILVPGSATPALLAPASAITVSGQMERVFVAGDGLHAVLRLVKTGAGRDGLVEILSGLGAGERVVTNPPAGLREGQPLEVQP